MLPAEALRQTRRELLELCDAVEDVAEHLGLPLEPFAELREELSSFQLRVLVAGEVNRGKSTFLNAILGAKVFPRRAVVCTAALTELRDGQPSMTVVYRGGDSKSHVLPVADAHKTVASFVSKQRNKDARRLERVRIEFPNEFARDGVVLVDTPGVNDPEEWREALTIEELRHADAAIMLLDCQKPLTASERDFLVEHVRGPWGRSVLFVANKADALDDTEREHVRERLQRELAGYLEAPPQVLLVSALNALRAREADGHPEADTGFLALEQKLKELLVDGRVELYADAMRKRLRQWAKVYLEDAQQRLTRADADVHLVQRELEGASRALARRRSDHRLEMTKQKSRLKRVLGGCDAVSQRASDAAGRVLTNSTEISKCVDVYVAETGDGDAAVRSLLAQARGVAASTADRGIHELLAEELNVARHRLTAIARTELSDGGEIQLSLPPLPVSESSSGAMIGLAAGVLLGAVTGGIGWAVIGGIGGAVLGAQAVAQLRLGMQEKLQVALATEHKRIKRALKKHVKQAAKNATTAALNSVTASAQRQFQHDEAVIEVRQLELSQRQSNVEGAKRLAAERLDHASAVFRRLQ